MGGGAKDSFERIVLAIDYGRIYTLRETAGGWAVSRGVTGIRSLHNGQANCCHPSVCAAAAGLLAPWTNRRTRLRYRYAGQAEGEGRKA